MSAKSASHSTPINAIKEETNKKNELPLKLYFLSVVPLILVVLINLFTGFDILNQIKKFNL